MPFRTRVTAVAAVAGLRLFEDSAFDTTASTAEAVSFLTMPAQYVI
jgi:hypothetical protein